MGRGKVRPKIDKITYKIKKRNKSSYEEKEKIKKEKNAFS